MNKRAILPLLILIPLMLVGLIIFFFVFKAVLGLLIKAVLWTLVLGFGIIVIYVVYKVIKYMVEDNKKK